MFSHLVTTAEHVLAIGALVFIGLLIIGLLVEHHERKTKAINNPDQPELPIEPPKPGPQIVNLRPIGHRRATHAEVPARPALPAPPIRAIASVPNLALERSVRRLPDDAA